MLAPTQLVEIEATGSTRYARLHALQGCEPRSEKQI
jgi:hypothetical protein